MATIYAKSLTDKTLILDPREYMLRPFDLGATWTEIRWGFFWTMVTSGGDDVPAVNEGVALNTVADFPVMGLKDAATTALPGQAGSLFLGNIAVTVGDVSAQIFGGPPDHLGGSAVGGRSLAGYHGVTLKGGLVDIGAASWYWPQANLVNGYNGFMGIKYVITDRGLATQTVTLTQAAVSPVPGLDYSVNNLRTYLNNTPYANGSGLPPVQWNDGVAAYALPDAVFVHLPFYNNRIRISAMQIIRYV